MLFYELSSGFDVVAHEGAEEGVGAGDVVHFHLEEGAVGGVERGGEGVRVGVGRAEPVLRCVRRTSNVDVAGRQHLIGAFVVVDGER